MFKIPISYYNVRSLSKKSRANLQLIINEICCTSVTRTLQDRSHPIHLRHRLWFYSRWRDGDARDRSLTGRGVLATSPFGPFCRLAGAQSSTQPWHTGPLTPPTLWRRESSVSYEGERTGWSLLWVHTELSSLECLRMRRGDASSAHSGKMPPQVKKLVSS